MFQATNSDITDGQRRSNDPGSSVNAPFAPPAVIMATLLRTMGTDLSDEREVIRVLIGARFTDSQVKTLMDEAVALAR